MSYTVREFSHAAKKMITVAVAKGPWENIISVSITLEEKFRISARPCNILYLYLFM